MDAERTQGASGSAVSAGSTLGYETIGLVTEDHLPLLFKGKPLSFWFAIFSIGIAVSLVLALQQPAPVRYFVLCSLLVTAAFLMVPLALHFCRTLSLDWGRSIGAFVTTDTKALYGWYNNEMRFFEGSRTMILAGVALGALAGAAYSMGHYFEGLTAGGELWAESIVCISAFFAGCGLWVTYKASNAVYKLGQICGGQIIVVPGKFGILSTGRVLAQSWMIIGGVWFFYSLSALLGPPYTSFAELLRTYPVLMLGLPTLPFIVGTFVLGQVPMHSAMVEYKRQEIQAIDRRLLDARSNAASYLSQENRETIEFLLRRRAEAESLPEWPFNNRALAAVGSSVVTAVAPLVLKGFLPVELLKQIG